jgi:hypothetical protein
MPMLALRITGVLYSLELTLTTRRNYMKKSITIILTTLSLILILDSFNFMHALMMFYFAGLIPGTNITLSGAQMLELFAVAAGFTVARVALYFIRQSAQYFQPTAAVPAK